MYNTAMSQIFPILQTIVFGVLAGLIINLTVDGLYVYHDMVSEAFKEQYFKRPYWRGLFMLAQQPEGGQAWRMRVLLVWGSGLLATIGIHYLSAYGVEFWWGYPLALWIAIVTVIDIESRYILRETVWVGVVGGYALGVYFYGWWPIPLLGGAIGFGLMGAMYGLGVLYLRYLNRRDGDIYDPEEDVALGFGDVQLAAIMGLLLGIVDVFYAFFWALVFGGIVGVILLLVSKFRGEYRSNLAMPYGPYILLAIVVHIYFRAFL